MSNNKIEIILNYNGKFKEKYSLIYEDQEKINNLIFNNAFTKNVAGEKLYFLKNGKYLINFEKELIYEENYFTEDSTFIGKDLETDEFVTIKEIPIYYIGSYDNEVNTLKKLSKIKHSCKYLDDFKTKDYYYIVNNLYDTNLFEFLNNLDEDDDKRLPPNLIKKIFSQLNEAFKGLLNYNLIHGNINACTILIKYTNEEKTNFDSFLHGYFSCQEFEPNLFLGGNALYMSPENSKGEGCKINSDLFIIGANLYFLYFGRLYLDDFTNCEVHLNNQIEEDKQLEDLINKCLKVNPDERISWEEYFEHPFFRQYEY